MTINNDDKDSLIDYRIKQAEETISDVHQLRFIGF